MSQKFRLSELKIKSWTTWRSWLITENMTSATADHLVGTSRKNVQVDENWEFVVWPLSSNACVSRIHLDSWTLIQGNIYPDYQEQTMTIAWDRYRSVELPVWYTTLTMNGIKTILHDDTAVRWSFVLDIMNNGASVHTITLPSWTSLLDTTWLSIPFADGDKFSVVITTADSGNTVWAEIFISYNIA